MFLGSRSSFQLHRLSTALNCVSLPLKGPGAFKKIFIINKVGRIQPIMAAEKLSGSRQHGDCFIRLLNAVKAFTHFSKMTARLSLDSFDSVLGRIKYF